MSLTDQELENFLQDIGVFSDEKLETLLESREKPKLPEIPPAAPQPRLRLPYLLLALAFCLGLAFGLAYSLSVKKELGEQMTYIIHKLSELENPNQELAKKEI